MKKILLLGFMVVLASITSPGLLAQKMNIGLNGALSLPLGDLDNGSNVGFGGDVSLDYYFNDRFDLGIEAGVRSFSNDGVDGSFTSVPLLLTGGVHQDIDDWIDLYGELGLGAYVSKRKVELPFFGTQTASGTYFGFSPRVGAAFELSSVFFLDVNIKYHYVLSDADFGYNYNFLGFNVGVLYTLTE